MAYDTYDSFDAMEGLIVLAGHIPDGAIIVAASNDDCTKKLNTYCKEFFIDMGSREIMEL